MSRDTAKSRTGWIFDPLFLEHNAQRSHPESPDRLRAITSAVTDAGLMPKLNTAEFQEASDKELQWVHRSAYLESLQAAEGQYWDSDTFVGPNSPTIARRAAGGILTATGKVWSGEWANAFCAVRPPGHHAPANRAMGFCLLNNVAVAAANLRAADPEVRVMILDWDVHHGNGTQEIFYNSPDVLYASLHQFPFYPGSGGADEIGRDAGKGYTINKPLAAGSGDQEFLDAIDAIIDEANTRFRPDLIILSAGFDAHHADPLGGLKVTTECFATATKRVTDYAAAACRGRLVSVLEGGYDLTALGESVAVHIDRLITAGLQHPRENPQ
jgi:acetoin utilization deacetylase AcuC-like enzyme